MGKQVKKCRFYVDLLSYIHNVGTVPQQFYEHDPENLEGYNNNFNGSDLWYTRYKSDDNRSGQMTNLLYMNPYNPNHYEHVYTPTNMRVIEHIGGNKGLPNVDGYYFDFGIRMHRNHNSM